MTHTTDECTGQWRLIQRSGCRVIQCDKCYNTYGATEANRREAIDENYAGIYMRRLAAEGANMIGGQG